MWALVRAFSKEVATDTMKLKSTRNCVKLLKRALPYIEKMENLFPLRLREKNILVNFYSEPERNYIKPLQYGLCKQVKV